MHGWAAQLGAPVTRWHGVGETWYVIKWTRMKLQVSNRPSDPCLLKHTSTGSSSTCPVQRCSSSKEHELRPADHPCIKAPHQCKRYRGLSICVENPSEKGISLGAGSACQLMLVNCMPLVHRLLLIQDDQLVTDRGIFNTKHQRR